MFEASAVGIALTDENRRFVAANKAFQRMMGYTEEELCRLGPIEITYEDDREATQEMLDDMLSGRQAHYHVEKRYRRKDGSVIWVRVSTARALEPGNSLRGLPTIIEDVTERKRAEEALRNAQADLARAARLTTMGELAASIAHEVNQPLMAVVTNADTCLSWLTRDEPDLDEAQRAAERIVRAGHRAGDIVRAIHSLARKSSPDMKLFDINAAISDVLVLASDELRRHDVSLRTELSTDVEPVLGNRGQLQQVLLNLTVNAIEAMSAVVDRPRILRVSSQMDRSAGVLIAVADTGVGLDSTEMDRIFDAFFTTKPEGIGMGLSICRSIVEAHGGQLSVSSNPARGSVFQFTLPAAGAAGIANDVAG
jgi:PAS domain S-box-containing protein